MATAALRRALTAVSRPPDPPDADLLRQFAGSRSEPAFAALVRRHGPLVLGVCRRVVPDRHLADDAFQAAFVVLARRAGRIDPTRPLGPWLYGVAHRVALRARTMLGKRRTRETLAAAVPDVPAPGGTGFPAGEFDATAILDDEIAKLPAAVRDAVVLCELQGLSRRDAAAKLGIAEGTLSSRLASARKTLASKLQTRGVVLGVALASAAVLSSDLVAATVAAGTGAVLTSVVGSLANGASAMTLLNKLKLTAVAVLFLLLTAGGAGPWGASETTAAPVPKEKPVGELLWTHNTKTGELTAHTPDGDTARTLKLKDGKHFFGLTPDGSRVAFAGKKGKLAAPDAKDGLTLHLRPVSDDTEGTDTGLSVVPGEVLYWSPDGTRVLRRRMGPDDKTGGFTYEHVLFDVATKKETKVALAVNQYAIGWLDAERWAVHEYVRADLRDPKLPRYRVLAVPAGGGKAAPLCDAVSLLGLEPAGDGKSFFAFGHAHTDPADDTDATYRRWFRVDDTGKATLVKTFTDFDSGDVSSAPDGKRVACLLRTGHDDASDSVLALYDPDGSNERKLLTLKKDGQHTRLLGWFPPPSPPADPKAKPPVKEPIEAPVPKAKENTMGLTAGVDLEKAEVMLGEPTGFTFTVTNPTESGWKFVVGGDQRNSLGRPNSFRVTVTGADGQPVPQPDCLDMGGKSWPVDLPAGGEHAFTLYLPHWAAFEKPGTYTVTVQRTLGLVKPDSADPFREKGEKATLTASARVTVTKPDAKKFGRLIDALGAELLDPTSKRGDRPVRDLLELNDERVIPHFVGLSRRANPGPRYDACAGLRKFKTDEAFAALKAVAATTAEDFKGTATRPDLEASSAAGVRGAAVHALAVCGHADALAEVWKAADDEYSGVRMTVLHKAYEVKSPEARKVIEKLTADADERVRTEAKRYAELLAKEKK